jgi:hypothetical protein
LTDWLDGYLARKMVRWVAVKQMQHQQRQSQPQHHGQRQPRQQLLQAKPSKSA